MKVPAKYPSYFQEVFFVRKIKIFLVAAVVFLNLSAGSANAQQVIGPTTILQVANGWSGEQFIMVVATGSSTCPAGPNEYTVRATHPAYKDIVAMALAAFATEAKIVLRPDGTCVDSNRAGILELRLAK